MEKSLSKYQTLEIKQDNKKKRKIKEYILKQPVKKGVSRPTFLKQYSVKMNPNMMVPDKGFLERHKK